MVYWGENRIPQAGGRVGAWKRPPPRRVNYQWLIIGLVGIILGGSVLGALLLPPQYLPFCILAILCPFIAMIVGNVRRLLLMFILLDLPFQLDINIGYGHDAVELNALGGLSASVTTVGLFLLYALWLMEVLSGINRQPRPRIWTGTTISLAAYLAFTILSVLVARDVWLSVYEIALLVQTFLLYIYIIVTVRSRQDVVFVATVLLIGLGIESLIMIGLRFLGHSVTVVGISARIDGGIRVGGTIGSPNAAAGYLTLFLAPTVSVLLTRLGRSYKWLAVFVTVVGIIALVFTLSRGGWISFAVSMMIVYFIAWRNRQLSLKTPLIGAFVIVIVYLLFKDTIANRLLGDEGSPPETRIYMMKLAWKIIQDHPMFGVGANNFALMIEEFATPEFSGAWLHVVHNKYLLVWTEAGIGALIAFCSFLAMAVHTGWRCIKLHDPLLSLLALGFTAGIVGQIIQMFFVIFNSRPQVQSLWFVVSLITAINLIGSKQTSNIDESN